MTRLPKVTIDEPTRFFISDAVVHMLQHGVSIHFEHDKSKVNVSEKQNIVDNGYFEIASQQKILHVNTFNEYWLETFVHEYGHFCQWCERDPVWGKSFGWEDWLFSRQKLTDAQAKMALLRLLDVELNCEQRVLILSQQYGLPIDHAVYCREVNALFYAYVVAHERKQWFRNSHGPAGKNTVLETVPDTLLPQAKMYLDVPEAYREAIKRSGCWSRGRK